MKSWLEFLQIQRFFPEQRYRNQVTEHTRSNWVWTTLCKNSLDIWNQSDQSWTVFQDYCLDVKMFRELVSDCPQRLLDLAANCCMVGGSVLSAGSRVIWSRSIWEFVSNYKWMWSTCCVTWLFKIQEFNLSHTQYDTVQLYNTIVKTSSTLNTDDYESHFLCSLTSAGVFQETSLHWAAGWTGRSGWEPWAAFSSSSSSFFTSTTSTQTWSDHHLSSPKSGVYLLLFSFPQTPGLRCLGHTSGQETNLFTAQGSRWGKAPLSGSLSSLAASLCVSSLSRCTNI